MRRIVVCAALAGSLLLAGAAPASAAPRGMGIGLDGGMSDWLGDLLSGVLSRFFDVPGPAPAGDPFPKTGCTMDPWGRPICPVVVGEPSVPHWGRVADPFAKNGCEMDPNGKPICPAVAGESSGHPVRQGLRLVDRTH